MNFNLDEILSKKPKWIPVFERLLADKGGKLAVRGGRGGLGKSTTIAQMAKLCLLLGISVVIVRAKKEDIRNSNFEAVRKQTQDIPGIYVNKSIMQIRLGNATAYFLGLSDPESIKSRETTSPVRLIVFDEATQIKDYNSCNEAIKSFRSNTNQPLIMWLYNPNNWTHWLYDFEKQEDVDVMVGTVYDNKYLPEWFVKDIESQKDTSRHNNYLIEALGEWIMSGYQTYPKVPTASQIGIQYDIINIGVDIGISDPTSFVATGVKNGFTEATILAEYTHHNKKDPQQKTYADYVKDLYNFYNQVRTKFYSKRAIRVFVEWSSQSQGKEFIAMAKAMGIPASKCKKDKIDDRIMFETLAFENNRLLVNEACVNLLTELRGSVIEEDTGQRADYNDHLITAMEYSFQEFSQRMLANIRTF